MTSPAMPAATWATAATALQFEPLLATRVTATHTIRVYNHSGKTTKVNEIELHSANGNFQINVDGRTGTRFFDVEIPDGDSIYIFVRAKVPEQSVDTAVLIQDSITFSYNGNHDRIVPERIQPECQHPGTDHQTRHHGLTQSPFWYWTPADSQRPPDHRTRLRCCCITAASL